MYNCLQYNLFQQKKTPATTSCSTPVDRVAVMQKTITTMTLYKSSNSTATVNMEKIQIVLLLLIRDGR